MTETKIEKILRERNMSQGDLVRLIKAKSGFKIGRDRISKICTGRLTNYTVETARMISEALEVPMDDIVQIENVKKNNRAV
jgi:DNA-binding Xre family transcriptional regulator